ncbi:MAG: DUF1016 family protein [Deltaproteobacteria bacterium]|nr:DUF1016 family protein [Deltaproteobacteria bacterium]
MVKRRTTSFGKDLTIEHYDEILADIAGLLEEARVAAARTVNAFMTATYWAIGLRIVEHEQSGEKRAEYGEAIITRLSADLSARFGRGFGRSNLFQMRAFYLAYSDKAPFLSRRRRPCDSEKKVQTASGQFVEAGITEKVQTASVLSSNDLSELGRCFPLSWSHYVQLLSLENPEARTFYEAESIRGGWTVRQLARQIDSQFYERALLSKNKSALLRKGRVAKPEDAITPEAEIKDPYVLEFLRLKDEYSENDLESALVLQLESFLLELGGDFAFIGRQRRLRVGNEWYRVDLLFYHRRLRCLVVIDLKLGKFTHADAGQMHLYLNYAREHWTLPNENPPVGLVLCAHKDADVAHYALEGLPNKVLAAEYRMALPDEKSLAAELERTRRVIEGRHQVKVPRDSCDQGGRKGS